jgi:hypothetical protein
MEAVMPLASLHPLATEAPEAVGHAARDRALALGAEEAFAARVALAAETLARLPGAADLPGELLVAPLRTPWGAWIDLVRLGADPALDAHHPALAERVEGLSTARLPAGTLGPSAVTLAAARLPLAPLVPGPPLEVAGFVRAYPGQPVSGDALLLQPTATGVRAAVVDALGHGEAAARSAAGLLAYLAAHATVPPLQLVQGAHAVRAAEPRGAAVAVLDLRSDGQGEFLGIGNVEAIALGQATRPASRAGTVGVAVPRFVLESVTVAPGAAVALVSDGLAVRGPALALSSLERLSAPLLLGVLLASAVRRVDDAAVLVVRRPV